MSIAEPIAIERHDPFQHLYSPGFLPADVCSTLYDFLDAADQWHLPEGSAPDDGPIWFINEGLPKELEFLGAPDTIASLKNWLTGIYGVTFGDKCELIANKMSTGQGVRPHTDFHDAAPSHRIVIFVTRDWTWESGGELWLLKSNGAQINRTGHVQYPPLAGDAITFGISPQSYHTVQITNQGARYSMTYSFYPPNVN